MARSRPRGSADPAPAAARSATAGSRARAGSTPARTRSNAPTRITGEARSAGSAPAARNLADRADRSAPDLLARYRAKRDFSKTPEPAPRAPAPRDTGLAFTIQRHDARRLHYDFRLEWDGVLKSWAVPKGPSLDPAQKRLAVQTEDHPLDYGTFEGAIPAGEYGGGDVLLWDYGHWRPLHDASDGLAKGKLHFELSGHKLQGEWVLVRLPARETDRPGVSNWLLRKVPDAFARAGSDDAIVRERPDSVAAQVRAGEAALDTAVPKASATSSTSSTTATTATTKRDATRAAATGAAAADRKPAVAARATSAAGPRTNAGAAASARSASPRRGSADRAAPIAPPPAFIAPQLATRRDHPPQGDDWVYEVKFDGYRMLARLDQGRVSIVSRNAQDWTARLPTLAAALSRLPVRNAWLDGEITVSGPDGRSSFQALQNALDSAPGRLAFQLFDLMWLDGDDLRARPLSDRHARLADLLADTAAPLRLSEQLEADGATAWDAACRMQLEGLIGKRRDAPYAAGRSPHWIKLKCRPVDEFVIGGWTDPAGSRSALGALLVGVHDDADGAASGTRLRYAGRVGTGFTEATLTRLRRALTALATDRPPFDPAPRLPRSNRPHWVEPRLVAQVEYAELTSEGLLRQASFLGLREDKPAAEVVSGADTAAPAGEDVTGAATAAPAVAPAEPVARAGRSGRGTRTARADPSSDSTGTPAPASSRAVRATGAVRAGARRNAPTAATAATTETAATAAQSDPASGTHVSAQLAALPKRISHADRVVYANGLTKLDVARYYATMAPLMLPELRGRPLSLLRCPQGTQGTCFFQKHIATRLPPGLVPVQVQEKDGPSIYIAVDHEEGLVSLAQHAAIELHPWGSRVPDLARPDRLVIDLDPDESIDWPTVIEAAWLARTLLEELGLTAFVRTTGGKGLHVVSPLTPRAPWSTVKPFAQAIARQLARVAPQRFTSNMAKDKRRGRIFIDYLRNAEGATAIASFSLRARDGAPVSMPVAWDELKPKRDLRNDHFNLRNAAAAAAAAQAAWAGVEAAARPLQPSMLAALDLDPALSLD